MAISLWTMGRIPWLRGVKMNEGEAVPSKAHGLKGEERHTRELASSGGTCCESTGSVRGWPGTFLETVLRVGKL